MLLVDEVLAVNRHGDEAFQRKCGEKFAELRKEGKTIILVSHGMVAVHNRCDKVAWLDHGQVRMIDSARRVVDEYTGTVQVDSKADGVAGSAGGQARAVSKPSSCSTQTGSPATLTRTGDSVTVRLHYELTEPIEQTVFGVTIQTLDGTHVSGPNSRDAGLDIQQLEGRGHVDLTIDRLLLVPGTYDHSASLHDHGMQHPCDVRHHILRFLVEPGEPRETFGVVSLGGLWRIDESARSV